MLAFVAWLLQSEVFSEVLYFRTREDLLNIADCFILEGDLVVYKQGTDGATQLSLIELSEGVPGLPRIHSPLGFGIGAGSGSRSLPPIGSLLPRWCAHDLVL